MRKKSNNNFTSRLYGKIFARERKDIMLQCSLTELIDLSDIIRTERFLSEKYKNCSEGCTDPQLKEKLQKCAADHIEHCCSLQKLFNE